MAHKTLTSKEKNTLTNRHTLTLTYKIHSHWHIEHTLSDILNSLSLAIKTHSK